MQNSDFQMFGFLQQKCSYQPSKNLPVCGNNHNRPNLAFISPALIPWW